MRLDLSRLHFPVTTLGPGQRVGVWFQGCSIRCVGCVSADTWGHGRGTTTVAAVLTAIEPWLAEADGVTISGGEPFDQADSLRELLRGIRARPALDVLVYSGHAAERVRELVASMEGLIDALITDPYDASASQTLALRGSDNQRLHRLTALGEQRFATFERAVRDDERTLDLMIDDGGTVWMAGIPRQGDMRRLQRFLEAQGHLALTSQASRESTACREPTGR